MAFSLERLPSNPPPANGLPSQSTQQPLPLCQWTIHAPQSGLFPRSGHTLTATGTAASKLFLFGGYYGRNPCASNDLYMFSTQDFSTTLWQTSGDVPAPRRAHGAALIGTTLLICGGKTDSRNVLNHDSLYLFNSELREWTRVMVNGPGPNSRFYNTTTVVGSKLFIFGGWNGTNNLNDMWTLNLSYLKSQPHWEKHEPTPGSETPPPRSRHVSVTTEYRIIIFGGYGNGHKYYHNDTWSFDIMTRRWTKLQCTGSIPSPRAGHAAVLVDDVMYVFGGFNGKTYLDDLIALQLSTLRWFHLQNVGPSPHRRAYHTMGSDGTRVFVLGGLSKDAPEDAISLSVIHVFDTADIKYPEPERNTLNPNENTNPLAWRSFTGLPTQEQSQYPRFSSSETHVSRVQSANPAGLSHPATLQITHRERNSGPSGSAEYHTTFAAPHSSSEGEVTRLEFEFDPQLLALLAEQMLVAQAERGQRITPLNDELEQVKADVAESVRLELRKHEDRLLAQTSLVKQKDVDLVDMRARLGQYEKDLTNVRAKLEENEFELEAVRQRLTDAEESLTRSKAEAEALRAQTATGLVNGDQDQVSLRTVMERIRAIEAEIGSEGWNEKSIEEVGCRNEE